MSFQVIFDQGTYVLESINNLMNAGLWGGILAFLVVYFFLRRFRMTLIINLAMPITMATLTTVVVFLPLIFMGDNPGMTFYMARMGVPVISALLASLFVALIFIPLATMIFSAAKEPL